MENLSTEVPAEKTAGEKVFKKIDREKRRADKARTGFIIATVVSFACFVPVVRHTSRIQYAVYVLFQLGRHRG